MKQIVLAAVMFSIAAPAMPAPAPVAAPVPVPATTLRAALARWAAPASVARFQYTMIDLNADSIPDAVVLVTDPASCGNGGCPLLVFKGTATGYELVANSGFVRKPVYLLKEVNSGWHALAAAVGLGANAGMVPIRYKGTEYNPTPFMRGQIKLSSAMVDQQLDFEDATELKFEAAPL